jgi:hypothetical protein
MSNRAQIIANRQNALKSTGPRSNWGKIKASRNSFKHGLSAKKFIINSENKAYFDIYHDRLMEELEPVGPMETVLCERIISLLWRLQRAEIIQNQTIDALRAANEASPLTKLIQSMFPRGQNQSKDGLSTTDPELALGRLAIRDFSNSRVLERLLMYERRLEHSLYKTILELQRRQIMRKMNELDAGIEKFDN